MKKMMCRTLLELAYMSGKKTMHIETERLIITEFDISMAESVYKNSLDEDTRRFLPDEVFESVEEAQNTIDFLIKAYKSETGPFVYPVLLKNGTNIGYVQLVSIEKGYEVGYHIGKSYTKKGYATEALKAFLADIMQKKSLKNVYGITCAENVASQKVLEKCGFKRIFHGKGEYQGKFCEIIKYVLTVE